jgi:hypothetical protein
MTKTELIQKVLENPEPACGLQNGLKCYGGFNAGEGQLKWYGKWEFVPGSATGKSFEPTNEFVKEVIGNNFRKLLRYYK